MSIFLLYQTHSSKRTAVPVSHHQQRRLATKDISL